MKDLSYPHSPHSTNRRSRPPSPTGGFVVMEERMRRSTVDDVEEGGAVWLWQVGVVGGY